MTPRPHRPNVEGRGKRGAERMKTHVRQETRAEMKARKRREAEERAMRGVAKPAV